MKALRWLILLAAIVFNVIVFPPILLWMWPHFAASEITPKIEPFTWGDAAQEAFAARLQLSSTLFQSALLLIAGIWGMLIVKKDDAAIVFDDWQGRAMLLLTTLALVISCASHYIFVNDMTDIALAAANTEYIPDLTQRDISYSFLSQSIALIGGACLAALTVISATWLREGTSHAKKK